MKYILQLFERLYWRYRHALKLPCAHKRELKYRIMRLPSLNTPESFFPFPWGRIEYVEPFVLRGQYSEIYDERHYAFRTDSAVPVIIDGGGNIGMSAIWFKQEYPQARLTVYEADPEVIKILHRNLAATGTKGVDVINAAVWTRDGTVSFNNLGLDMGSVQTDGAIRIPSIDLAEHLPERVDLLKLDIEGAEYSVVERLCSSGAIRRVRNFVAEYHVRRGDFDSFLNSLQLLRQAGFQVTATSVSGSWLGQADAESAFERIGRNQILAEVYAWR